jgi:hypothetical protein
LVDSCRAHRDKIHGATAKRGKTFEEELLRGGLGPHS